MWKNERQTKEYTHQEYNVLLEILTRDNTGYVTVSKDGAQCVRTSTVLPMDRHQEFLQIFADGLVNNLATLFPVFGPLVEND